MDRICTLCLLMMIQIATPVTTAAGRNPGAPVMDDPRVPELQLDLRRNVLLIVADDLGPDNVSSYVDYYASTAHPIDATDWASTPTIDAIADAGIMFTNAWASALCSPTRAGLFTGTHSFRHGIYEAIDESGGDLADTVTTLADVLGDVGYGNGLFGKWHLGSGTRPLDQGWDRHAGVLEGHLEDYFDWTKISSSLHTGDTVVAATITGPVSNYATWENVDDAVDWINSRSGRFMATMAFNAPHTVFGSGGPEVQGPPYACTGRAITESETVPINPENAEAKEYYRAMIECLDDSISDLLSRIDEAKLTRTTIVFIGDNGPEDNLSDHFSPAKGTILEGGVNVPFIIANGYEYQHPEQEGPGLYRTGRVSNPGRVETALVQTVDLFATIAEIAGADSSSGLDSVSLIPLLDESATTVRDVAYTELTNELAVRRARFKLVVLNYSGTPSCRLFNLQNDRWESTDLLADGANAVESYVVSLLLADISTIDSSLSLTCP